jgi:hypothetical protein
MPFPKKTWGKLYEKIPFEIVGGESDNIENPYKIENGFLFNTFSLDIQKRITINGIGTTFDFKKNHKFYIEIDVDTNLQPYNAQIKCTEVNTDENWKYYPFNSLIQPEFEEEQREKQKEFPWDSGRILKFPQSRIQTKLYILIGYRADDENKNGNQGLSLKEDTAPIQILKENVILLGGIVDSAPGLIPVPYFYGGLTHLDSIQQEE